MRDKIRNESMKVLNIDSNTSTFVNHALRIFEDAYDMNHLSIMRKLK